MGWYSNQRARHEAAKAERAAGPTLRQQLGEAQAQEREKQAAKQVAKQDAMLLKFEGKQLARSRPSDEFVVVSANSLTMAQLAARGWEVLTPPVAFFSGSYTLRIGRRVLQDRLNIDGG